MRAAIYLRVSTAEQTTDNQRSQVEACARQRGFTEITLVEEVASGAKKRPALAALIDDACRGRYRGIFVWAIDRLGRTSWEISDTVRKLDAAGVRLVSVREPWLDTGGPFRDLLLSMFAFFAQFERDRMIERTMAGLEAAKARGRKGGRPRKLTPMVLAKALDAIQNGVSVADAARIGSISRQTLYRALRAAHGAGLPGGDPVSETPTPPAPPKPTQGDPE